ncbi:MAG: hypothetical protein ACYDH0_00325 [Candidatus Aminicenantales bacterium]
MGRTFCVGILLIAATGLSATPIILVSPEKPNPGGILRVLAVGENAPEKPRIRVEGPSGEIAGTALESGGGPPFWSRADFKTAGEGDYTISLIARGKTLATRRVAVSAGRSPDKPRASVWVSEQGWDRGYENLYSAWIESLFGEAEEGATWPSLHVVTRDPRRNFLHNHLGLGEDDADRKPALVMEPDCADNPFYLRAYFAWKLGLPFGFHESDRGTLERAPRTGRWITNASRQGSADRVQAFNFFLRATMNAVHSGTARTRLDDDASDYFPVPLTREALRPGVVFADPYGHTLTVVRWVPQTGKRPGMLLSVDAQPDAMVGIKRFWKGNFLFATSDVIGEPGFKAFRPIVEEAGRPRLLRNSEIRTSPEYGVLSVEQKGLNPEAFYDRMERLINPDPLDPESALRDLCRALHEQLLIRVKSVANSEAYTKSHPGAVIPMPGGTAAVFQTTGPWEDFSTPNRDLRLLIAMDTITEFPDKVVRSPEAFKSAKRRNPESVRAELQGLRTKIARELEISYVRSDGKEQTLTLEEILKRKDAFEMAYNPNDGIEIRWGAPEGSPERISCRRRAPSSQVQKMLGLRSWFRKRLHPPT